MVRKKASRAFEHERSGNIVCYCTRRFFHPVGVSSSESLGQYCSSLSLDAKNLCLRAKTLDRHSNTCGKVSSSYRNQNRSEIRHVIQDFQAYSANASLDFGIAYRIDERQRRRTP